jgi:hypothetical protein
MSAHTKVRLTLRDRSGMMDVILPVSVKMGSKACIGAAKGKLQLLIGDDHIILSHVSCTIL